MKIYLILIRFLSLNDKITHFYYKFILLNSSFYNYAINVIIDDFETAFADQKEIIIVLNALREHINAIQLKSAKKEIINTFNLYEDFDQYILSPDVLRKYLKHYNAIMKIKSDKTSLDLIKTLIERNKESLK